MSPYRFPLSELVSSSGSNPSSNGLQSSGSDPLLSVQPFPGSSSSSEGSSPDVVGLPPFAVEDGHSDSVFDPPFATRQEFPKDRSAEWRVGVSVLC